MAEVIFRTVHGSHLYGLNHGGSDRDVYEVVNSPRTRAYHRLGEDGTDTVTVPFDVFLLRVLEGSHQSVEALFSREKEWSPGFQYLQPMIESFRVTGAGVFAKYERTITAFAYGDFKRRRHAARLFLNLRDLRAHGKFNPRLTDVEIRYVNNLANAFSGDDLRGALLG